MKLINYKITEELGLKIDAGKFVNDNILKSLTVKKKR